MREIGRPTVSVHYASGTREEIVRNRKSVEYALQSALIQRGDNRELEISWNDAPMGGKPEAPACRRSNGGVSGQG